MPTAAPTSVRSSARTISPEELQQELSKSTPPPRDQTGADVTPDEPQQQPNREGVKGFLGSLNEKMKQKAAEPKEETPEPEAEVPEKKEAPEPKKATVSKDDAPPAKKDTEIVLTEEEKGVLPHDSARVRARILYLDREKKKAEAEREAVRKELEAAKAAPQTAVNAEEVAKLKAEHARLNDEATRLRRRFDWENDAQTKAQFREPVAAAEKTIEEALKRNGYNEQTLTAIKDAGGFAAFSRSKATYPIETVDADTGEKVIRHTTAAELARSWLTRLPVADAQLISQSVGKQEILTADEKLARAKAEEEATKYYESQTAGQRAQQEAAQQNQAKLAAEYDTWAKTTQESTDWLKDQVVDDNAPEEEKKAVAERNALAAELRDNLKKHPTTPQEYGELKLNAAKAKYLEKTLAEREARIAELEAQVKRTSKALKTTPKSGSILKGPAMPEKEKPKAGDTDFMGNLNRAMQAKLAGGGDDE